MSKRYQIFISSTYLDLKDERQLTMRVVLELNHMPAGMELFPASDDKTWKLITNAIDTSDYYILLIGGRYGSYYDEDKTISFTEKEYDYAVSKNIPVIPFLNESSDMPAQKEDSSAKEKLTNFRNKIKSTHTPQYWADKYDLLTKVNQSISLQIQQNPRPGWIRATEMTEPSIDISTQNDKHESADDVLDEELIEILKVIVNYGSDDPPDSYQIASMRDMSEQKAQYYLDLLLDLDYVHPHYNMVYATRYSLMKSGRKYLVEHGII